MATMNEVKDFYSKCMGCSKGCKGVLRNPEKGIFPRGFYTERTNVAILCVGKNPGDLLKGEIERYRGKKNAELVDAHFQVVRDVFFNPSAFNEPSKRFHKNLKEYLAYFSSLNNGEEKEIFQNVAYTNLVKCSFTKRLGERARLSSEMKECCFNTWFLEELQVLRPTLILALGREVQHFLDDAKKVNKNKMKNVLKKEIPVIYIKHPSYPYKKTIKNKELNKIKRKIKCEIEKKK